MPIAIGNVIAPNNFESPTAKLPISAAGVRVQKVGETRKDLGAVSLVLVVSVQELVEQAVLEAGLVLEATLDAANAVALAVVVEAVFGQGAGGQRQVARVVGGIEGGVASVEAVEGIFFGAAFCVVLQPNGGFTYQHSERVREVESL